MHTTSTRTGFLAQLLGGYIVIDAIAMLLNRPMLTDALNALLHDASQVFIWGSLCAVGGLAFVIGHNRWSGGALTVAVTVIGWLTLLKGLALLFLPLSMAAAYFSFYESAYYLYVAIALVLGAWLCYAGRKSSGAATAAEIAT
jgi:hypothetical protein